MKPMTEAQFLTMARYGATSGGDEEDFIEALTEFLRSHGFHDALGAVGTMIKDVRRQAYSDGWAHARETSGYDRIVEQADVVGTLLRDGKFTEAQQKAKDFRWPSTPPPEPKTEP